MNYNLIKWNIHGFFPRLQSSKKITKLCFLNCNLKKENYKALLPRLQYDHLYTHWNDAWHYNYVSKFVNLRLIHSLRIQNLQFLFKKHKNCWYFILKRTLFIMKNFRSVFNKNTD